MKFIYGMNTMSKVIWKLIFNNSIYFFSFG